MTFEMAVALSYIFGMILAFFLARTFVFTDAHTVSHSGDGGRLLLFAIVNVVSLAIVWIVSVSLVRLIFPAIGYTYHAELVAHCIGMASPALPSWLAHKHFTFRT
jgi:putative flippase GtrA